MLWHIQKPHELKTRFILNTIFSEGNFFGRPKVVVLTCPFLSSGFWGFLPVGVRQTQKPLTTQSSCRFLFLFVATLFGETRKRVLYWSVCLSLWQVQIVRIGANFAIEKQKQWRKIVVDSQFDGVTLDKTNVTCCSVGMLTSKADPISQWKYEMTSFFTLFWKSCRNETFFWAFGP